jgi:hypothetical protein
MYSIGFSLLTPPPCETDFLFPIFFSKFFCRGRFVFVDSECQLLRRRAVKWPMILSIRSLQSFTHYKLSDLSISLSLSLYGVYIYQVRSLMTDVVWRIVKWEGKLNNNRRTHTHKSGKTPSTLSIPVNFQVNFDLWVFRLSVYLF